MVSDTSQVIIAGATVSKAAGSLMVRVNPERKAIKSPKTGGKNSGVTPLTTISQSGVSNRNKLDPPYHTANDRPKISTYKSNST